MDPMDERDPWQPPPDVAEREEGGFATRVIPDLFRRALMTGIGSVFMTEESIKNALSDLKMPKEAINYVVTQADRTKKELIATLARELRGFLNNLELDKLIKSSLEDTTLEIHTTITIKKGDDGQTQMQVAENRTEVVKAKKKTKKKKKSSSSGAEKTEGETESKPDED